MHAPYLIALTVVNFVGTIIGASIKTESESRAGTDEKLLAFAVGFSQQRARGNPNIALTENPKALLLKIALRIS